MQKRLFSRGVKKDSNEFIYGYYARVFDNDGQVYDSILEVNPFFEAVENRDYEHIIHCYPVKPETLGQTTRRHDMNGVEIFEHDILEVHGRIGLVIFYNDYNTLVFKYKKHPTDKDFSYHDFNWYKDKDLKIIGNLMQTPEKLNYEISN